MTDFDDIVSGLDLEFTPADVVNVALLSDVELSSRFTATRQELLKLDGNQMLAPSTETGRRLHSERAALLVEMRKRGLK